ncbi:MAG: ureidoglycolate lyase [Candidatus Omnitrophota bacterium]
MKKCFKVRPITRSSFKPYGWLIDFPRKTAPKSKNLFRIVVRQPKNGWRIAYLVVRDKVIRRLEQHPKSLESFEPVSGRALLYVSKKKQSSGIRCFLLDKPVVLKKGIWHGIMTLGKETDVKITENVKVRCVTWPLGFDLKAT